MKLSTGMTTLLDKFSRTLIGIEFKKDKLLITCLKSDLSGLNFLSSSSFPLKDDDETLKEINNFIADGVRGPYDVYVNIPHEWSIIKFTEIPTPKGKGKDAVAQMMKFEIERHIPYQAEDVFSDFQVVERSEDIYKVMFVAVHREKIDYVTGFLEKISLQPQIITISPLAILNSIELSEVHVGGWQHLLGIIKKPDIWGRKDDMCFSLFIDNDEVHFAVLRGGSCVHLNSFLIDLNEPLETIADNISSELSGLPPELSPEKTKKLILSRTTSSLPGLPEALGARLGITVRAVNPASKFLKEAGDPQMPESSPSLGTFYAGIGLGTSAINLLPHKTRTALRKTGALISKISLPIILFLIIGIFVGNIVNDKRLLMKIESKLEENGPEIKAIEKLSADISFFNQQINFLNNSRENNIVIDMLAELTNKIPKEAWITDFHYKEKHLDDDTSLNGELLINGFAVSSSSLISILEDSPFFKKVEFVGRVTKRGDKEVFKIKADTFKPPDSPEVLKPQDKKAKKVVNRTKGLK